MQNITFDFLCGDNSGKTFSRDDKMAAFLLCKAKLPTKDIRNQLQLAKATLKRVLMCQEEV
jgi:hypothetical protein